MIDLQQRGVLRKDRYLKWRRTVHFESIQFNVVAVTVHRY